MTQYQYVQIAKECTYMVSKIVHAVCVRRTASMSFPAQDTKYAVVWTPVRPRVCGRVDTETTAQPAVVRPPRRPHGQRSSGHRDNRAAV